jgi:curved DNA-binding protein CbpA
MKESKETYYDILSISQNATQSEIKKAYLEQCKNYHPDKLPSDIPEGARKYIQERMVLINEAYEILKDEISRRNYDQSLNSYNHSSSNENYDHKQSDVQHEDNHEISSLFSQSILERAARQLEKESREIEINFRNEIKRIETKYEKHLKTIKNHQPGNFEVMESSMKLEKSIVYGFTAFIGLWLIPLGGFLSFIGWTMFIISGYSCISSILSPSYKPEYVKEIQEAKNKRDSLNNAIKSVQHKKVKHFKSLPIEYINYDFVSRLTAIDRLYLLQAIKEKQDQINAEQAVKSTVKVAAAIGLMAVILTALNG